MSSEQRVLQVETLARLPESKFLRALGMEEVYTAPPQTRALSLRAAEEWERCPREDLAPHEAPHKQKYHKSGFSRVMLAATIANVGDPLLGSRTATAKTVGGYRVVVLHLGIAPVCPNQQVHNGVRAVTALQRPLALTNRANPGDPELASMCRAERPMLPQWVVSERQQLTNMGDHGSASPRSLPTPNY
jgi:hypothetical protein